MSSDRGPLDAALCANCSARCPDADVCAACVRTPRRRLEFDGFTEEAMRERALLINHLRDELRGAITRLVDGYYSGSTVTRRIPRDRTRR